MLQLLRIGCGVCALPSQHWMKSSQKKLKRIRSLRSYAATASSRSSDQRCPTYLITLGESHDLYLAFQCSQMICRFLASSRRPFLMLGSVLPCQKVTCSMYIYLPCNSALGRENLLFLATLYHPFYAKYIYSRNNQVSSFSIFTPEILRLIYYYSIRLQDFTA